MSSIGRKLSLSLALGLSLAIGCGPTDPAARVVDDTGTAYRLTRLNDLPLPATFAFPQPKTFYSGDLCLFSNGQYRRATTTDAGQGGGNRTTEESYAAYSLTTTPKTFGGATQVAVSAAADTLALRYPGTPENWLYVVDASRKSTACLLP